MKPFHITLGPKIHTKDDKIPSKKATRKIDLSHLQDVLLSDKGKNIFADVFSDFEHRIRSGMPINKNRVLERANDSVEFRLVRTCLKQRFSDEILNNTLLSLIRALEFNGKFVTRNGFDQLRTSSEILNLSDNTQKYFRSMAHHKSIFFLKQEEITFRFLFSDLIDKIAHYQTVSRKDILIGIDDARFSLVIKRLKNVYSNDIYQKICMKVRPVGGLKRF